MRRPPLKPSGSRSRRGDHVDPAGRGIDCEEEHQRHQCNQHEAAGDQRCTS